MSKDNAFFNNPTVKWIEHRLPIFSFVDHSLGSQYPKVGDTRPLPTC